MGTEEEEVNEKRIKYGGENALEPRRLYEK